MNSPPVVGSVVIPAHNEAGVIKRCLDALLADFEPGELDVVVSCNGCTDETADIVRSSGHRVRVLELTAASKSAALRAADQAVTKFPRIYLDADVVLTSLAARRVIESLTHGPALAARPPIEYCTKGSDWIVRGYYRARASIPTLMGSLWGAGIYALSAEGRERFDVFPDLKGDDLFVDQHFQPTEILIVDAPAVIVYAPHSVTDQLRMLRRVYQGNAENKEEAGPVVTAEAKEESTSRGLVRLAASQPKRTLDVIAYVFLAVLARMTLKFSPSTSWERDNSSRCATEETHVLTKDWTR